MSSHFICFLSYYTASFRQENTKIFSIYLEFLQSVRGMETIKRCRLLLKPCRWKIEVSFISCMNEQRIWFLCFYFVISSNTVHDLSLSPLYLQETFMYETCFVIRRFLYFCSPFINSVTIKRQKMFTYFALKGR